MNIFLNKKYKSKNLQKKFISMLKIFVFFLLALSVFSSTHHKRKKLRQPSQNLIPHSIYYSWMCPYQTNIPTGISLDPITSNVQCLSFNSKDCAWGDIESCQQSQIGALSRQPAPLVCGLAQASANGGESPYLISAPHWCKLGLAFYQYTGNWLCGGNFKLSDIPFRLNANGEVECFSMTGRDCAWGKGNDANCASYIASNAAQVRPLVCGDMHKKLYGSSGYNDKHHWCYVLMTQVFLKDKTKAF